jgi:hypothetical protein
MPLLVRASIAVCALLAASAAAVAGPSGDIDMPTREEREALRKSHMKLGGMTEPMAASEMALLAAQDDVDILSYFLQVEFIPASRSVTGSVTITGQSLVAGFQHLVLDLRSNMSVCRSRGRPTSLSSGRRTLIDITPRPAVRRRPAVHRGRAYSGVPTRAASARSTGGRPAGSVRSATPSRRCPSPTVRARGGLARTARTTRP